MALPPRAGMASLPPFCSVSPLACPAKGCGICLRATLGKVVSSTGIAVLSGAARRMARALTARTGRSVRVHSPRRCEALDPKAFVSVRDHKCPPVEHESARIAGHVEVLHEPGVVDVRNVDDADVAQAAVGRVEPIADQNRLAPQAVRRQIESPPFSSAT